MPNFSSMSLSCRNWSPNYSVPVLLDKRKTKKVGRGPYSSAKGGLGSIF
jgi:hypothetical protein